MSCIVNLLEFYNEHHREEMFVRHLRKLYDLHIECENWPEAGFTLEKQVCRKAFNIKALPDPESKIYANPDPGLPWHETLNFFIQLDGSVIGFDNIVTRLLQKHTYLDQDHCKKKKYFVNVIAIVSVTSLTWCIRKIFNLIKYDCSALHEIFYLGQYVTVD